MAVIKEMWLIHYRLRPHPEWVCQEEFPSEGLAKDTAERLWTSGVTGVRVTKITEEVVGQRTR